jgi:hypothetical protein
MYFKYSRKTGDDYIYFLLDDYFSPKKVLERVPVEVAINESREIRDTLEDEQNGDEEGGEVVNQETIYQSRLTIKQLSDYATSIQNSSSKWHNTFNPLQNTQLGQEEQKLLDSLNRIGIGYFRPLVMSSFMVSSVSSDHRIKLFKAIERFIFTAFRLSQARGNYRNSEFYNASRDLYYGNTSIDKIVASLNERLAFTFNDDGSFKVNSFLDFITNKFKYGARDGYYGWSGIRYVLYEYEQSLFQKSQNATQKITWDKFINQKDTVSIEHILPQTPDKPCWKARFSTYSADELNALTNSLGNLLALSQPKNSSLQNDCFTDKRADRNTSRGYFNGSLSENRVAEKYEEWTPEAIKTRGIELLGFMEERWQLTLGDEATKLKLLNLEFMQNN